MNKYHGRVWGVLPEDFPMKTLEKAYRNCIDVIGAENSSVQLMQMGLAGTAYRFRTMAENDEILSTSFKQSGYGPPAEDYYKQITSQYIFFSAGLSCVDSFFFAMYACAAHCRSKAFGLTSKDLKKVKIYSVKNNFNKYWNNTDIAIAMNELVASKKFAEWKDIRNILSHRAVIPREILLNCGNGQISANLLIQKADSEKQDIPLTELTTTKRRAWLANQMNSLVTAFDLFVKNEIL